MNLQSIGIQNPVQYWRVICAHCGYDWITGKVKPVCPKCSYENPILITQTNVHPTDEGDKNMATNPKAESKKNENAPTKKYRAGAIGVSVWKNTVQNDKGESYDKYSVSTQRSYKDKNDEWQKTTNMNVNDLPKLITLLQKAFDDLVMTKPSEANTMNFAEDDE
jgi:hypothetical protein